MQRSLKFVHTVATALLVGALALQLLVAYRYGAPPPEAGAAAGAARGLAAEVSRWLLVPSLVVVVVSGLLLMGINRSYGAAGWVWAKALIGLMLVKTVITLTHPAARDLATSAAGQTTAAGAFTAEAVAQLVRMEWNGAWVALVLSVAAIAFGVWRPRLSGQPRSDDRRAATAIDGAAQSPR
jgi:uncharacterized membrane protein